MNTNEIWKDIPDYLGIYKVSNLGRIKSLSRIINNNKSSFKCKEKILKIFIDKKGYCRSFLSKNSLTKQFLTHRIVSIAFIPNPENKPQINHINGIKNDNRVENLEWCTNSENQLHSYSNSERTIFLKKMKGKLHYKSKSVIQKCKNGKVIKIWDCMSDAQRILGLDRSKISACCLGKQKTCGGFIWEYNIENII